MSKLDEYRAAQAMEALVASEVQRFESKPPSDLAVVIDSETNDKVTYISIDIDPRVGELLVNEIRDSLVALLANAKMSAEGVTAAARAAAENEARALLDEGAPELTPIVCIR